MSAHVERMAKAAKVAADYRSYQDLPPGGIVVLWRMKGTGWACDLSFPRKFRPGALAVTPAGQVFAATGGNYWEGASEWSSVFDPTAVLNPVP